MRRLTRPRLRGNAMLGARGDAVYARHMTDITQLEEQIAHLTRTVEDLSDVVARQETELAMATRRLAMLMEREAGRELDAGGTVPLADQKPPHW